MWQAQVWVKWNDKAPKWKDGQTDWSWLKDWSEVQSAWSVMGDWDMLLTVKAQSPAELEKFIWGKLRQKDWVKETHTTWANQVWEHPEWNWKKSA